MSMPRVDIVIPVYRKNLPQIRDAVEKLSRICDDSIDTHDCRIVLGMNGPDQQQILALAEDLEEQFPRLRHHSVLEPGKGHGVLAAWLASDADIVAYMDVDLSTDIRALPDLLLRIDRGADISIGSRFHADSVVNRGVKRRLVSRIYHRWFMPLVLGSKDYSDSQCGFKAVNRRCVEEVIPLVRNRSWFWESELLYIAQRKGLRIEEIPVRWDDSEFSGLILYKAILEFLVCSVALRFRRLS